MSSKLLAYNQLIAAAEQSREELGPKLRALPSRSQELLLRLTYSVWRSHAKALAFSEFKVLNQYANKVEMLALEVSELLLAILVRKLDVIDIDSCGDDAPTIRTKRRATVSSINKDLEYADAMKKKIQSIMAKFLPRIRRSPESQSPNTPEAQEPQSPEQEQIPQTPIPSPAPSPAPQPTKRQPRSQPPSPKKDQSDELQLQFKLQSGDTKLVWAAALSGFDDKTIKVASLPAEHTVKVLAQRTRDGQVVEHRITVPPTGDVTHTSARIDPSSQRLEVTVPLLHTETPSSVPASQRSQSHTAAPRSTAQQRIPTQPKRTPPLHQPYHPQEQDDVSDDEGEEDEDQEQHAGSGYPWYSHNSAYEPSRRGYYDNHYDHPFSSSSSSSPFYSSSPFSGFGRSSGTPFGFW